MSTTPDERRREQLRLAQRRTRQRRQFQMQQAMRDNERMAANLDESNAAVAEALTLARDILFSSSSITVADTRLLERLADQETAHQARMARQAEAPIEMSATPLCVSHPLSTRVLTQPSEMIPASSERGSSSAPPGEGSRLTEFVGGIDTGTGFEIDIDDEEIERLQQDEAFVDIDLHLAQLSRSYFTDPALAPQQPPEQPRELGGGAGRGDSGEWACSSWQFRLEVTNW